MPSSASYVRLVLEQLANVRGLSSRPMMGEVVLYLHGRVVGGIYDNRLLVKPTSSAKRLLPEASYEQPYPHAKPMLIVENLEYQDFLKLLLESVAADLSTV